MINKLHVTIVCGGRSPEHEISVLSARNVAAALDVDKYSVSVVYIAQDGCWHSLNNAQSLQHNLPHELMAQHQTERVTVNFGNEQHPILSLETPNKTFLVDCFLPILHGPNGEDGTIQGLFEMANKPYIGPDVLGAAICMQKHIAKRLMRYADLPVVDWQMLRRDEVTAELYHELANRFGPTMFVKPVCLGSSIGIKKADNQQEFIQACHTALRYDDQILVEPFIDGREIECSVLGNQTLKASKPGEIIPTLEFYSYEAKYIDPEGAKVMTPANVPDDIAKKVQQISIEACRVLHVEGMARVDFFLRGNEILLNEVNTIPGFTNISMYPKNWEASGLPYVELLDEIITLAMQRHERKQQLSHKLMDLVKPY